MDIVLNLIVKNYPEWNEEFSVMGVSMSRQGFKGYLDNGGIVDKAYINGTEVNAEELLEKFLKLYEEEE